MARRTRRAGWDRLVVWTRRIVGDGAIFGAGGAIGGGVVLLSRHEPLKGSAGMMIAAGLGFMITAVLARILEKGSRPPHLEPQSPG